MQALKITNDNFPSEVMNSEKTVLLDFFADWCPSCRALSPIIDQIAAERADIKVGKVNINDEKALAERFGVSSIPALFVMKNGNVVNKSVGSRPKAEILSML